MLFMGEEWASARPFQFFCDFEGELAQAVRDGRRREFAKFPAFADPDVRDRIPDPNDVGDLRALEARLVRGRARRTTPIICTIVASCWRCAVAS